MVHRRWRLAFLLCCSSFVAGQYSGGQFFTSGLAIISSPQPNAQEHVGSTLSISIAVGGNQGQLKVFTPGSSTSDGTGYDNMELFLISADRNINLTVATDILTQESGSNVKHVSYSMPTCLQDGSYNLTLYETSRFQNNPIFVITQVPLTIKNNSPSGSCSGNNDVQTQPQDDTPLTGSPWVGGNVSKLSFVGKATFATTNPQVLASTPQQDPQNSQAGQQQGSQGSQAGGGNNSASANSPAATPAQNNPSTPDDPPLISQTTSTFTLTSEITPGATAASGGKGRPSVQVQTITVTTNILLPTAAGVNGGGVGGGGILFPISSAVSAYIAVWLGAFFVITHVFLFL